MAVPTTLHISPPCMRCTPSCLCGLGGGGLSPCRGVGEEGGGGRALLLGGGAGSGGRGVGGGCGGVGRAPCTAAGCGGRASTLCLRPRVGGRLLPMCMPAQVGGIGPPPLRTSAQAEVALGVAPLRPTPAPLPIEGLWVCCETAAPGGGLEFLSSEHHSTLGLGGERGGRGEGHGGLSGRAAWCPHTWVRACGTRPAPCGAAATPPRMRGPRATPERGRRPPRGGTCAAVVAGAPPGRAPPRTTRRTPAGWRPAPRRRPRAGSGAG